MLTGAIFSTAYAVIIKTRVCVAPVRASALVRVVSSLWQCLSAAAEQTDTQCPLMGPVCHFDWQLKDSQAVSLSSHPVFLFLHLPLPSTSFYNLLSPHPLPPLFCPLTPALLFTTCLAHSSSARWNNTPSHTKTSSVDSLTGPAHPPAATVYGAYDQMWGCDSTVTFYILDVLAISRREKKKKKKRKWKTRATYTMNQNDTHLHG